MTDAARLLRPVWAEVDLGALRHNTSVMRRLAAPAELCAVVKADAYGHGALAVARAVLDAGAAWLAVATVEEGIALREGGIRSPVLLLSEPTAGAAGDVVEHRLVPTIYTPAVASALADAAQRRGCALDVHVKVDTGMHRLGADIEGVVQVVGAVVAARGLRLGGLWTHLAVADGVDDEEDRAFTLEQLRRFDRVRDGLRAAGIAAPLQHVANSAATIAFPDARRDLVRCGISLYGEPPGPAIAPLVAVATGGDTLRSVLSLRARVGFVRDLDEGERLSYGRHYAVGERSTVATVPLGYADGVPRRYFTEGGTVLVGGRRRPLAGTVTMDHIMVDCGPPDGAAGGGGVAVGDEVVLIGRQGEETLTAGDWAGVLGTISYEVLCGIGPRVPRVVVDEGDTGDGPPAAEASP